jgi:hypothetical protein
MKTAYFFTLGVLFLAVEFLSRRSNRPMAHEG